MLAVEDVLRVDCPIGRPSISISTDFGYVNTANILTYNTTMSPGITSNSKLSPSVGLSDIVPSYCFRFDKGILDNCRCENVSTCLSISPRLIYRTIEEMSLRL